MNTFTPYVRHACSLLGSVFSQHIGEKNSSAVTIVVKGLCLTLFHYLFSVLKWTCFYKSGNQGSGLDQITMLPPYFTVRSLVLGCLCVFVQLKSHSVEHSYLCGQIKLCRPWLHSFKERRVSHICTQLSFQGIRQPTLISLE